MNWRCRICGCCSETSRDNHEGRDVDLWLMSNVLYFQNYTMVFSFLLKTTTKKKIYINYKGFGLLCFSALPSGKWSTKWSNVGVFWFRKHKGWPQRSRGGRWIVKSRFARGKWDIWQSLLVWGLYHNSTPPITVFHRTTIASTIITQSQHSFSPLKPLWPRARGVVCAPGGGHYWLHGEMEFMPWGRAPSQSGSARCQLYMLCQDWVTPQSNETVHEEFSSVCCLVHVPGGCFS